MRAVLQRTAFASVKVDGTITGSIQKGLLVLIGIEDADTVEDMEWLSSKIVNLRIFDDDNGVMNLSVKDVAGYILLVSQFTLHASTKKGNRPSFIKSGTPDHAKQRYQEFVDHLQAMFDKSVKSGIFAANMEVDLTNDGPVTIIIDSKIRE